MDITGLAKNKDFWRYGHGNTLQLVIKISERCNLACDYCYFFFGGDESYKEHAPIMSKSNIYALSDFLKQAIVDLSLTQVSVILHGGEPLMMKKERFSLMCEQMISAVTPLTDLVISLQTNAILIDDEWIDIFEKYNVYPGVSLDGPKELNDIHRVDKKGRGSHDRVVKGIKKLQVAEKNNRIGRVGVIMVANPEFNANEIYNYLTRDLGFTRIHFLLPDASHETFDSSQIDGFEEYLLSLTKAWIVDDRKDIDIRFFDSQTKRLVQDRKGRDIFNDYGPLRSIILSISSDGEISPDDSTRVANPSFMKTGLFIQNTTLLDAILHPTMRRISDETAKTPKGCLECDWEKVCRGGDISHHYKGSSHNLNDDAFDEKSVYCKPLTSFYEMLSMTLLEAKVPEEKLEIALGMIK